MLSRCQLHSVKTFSFIKNRLSSCCCCVGDFRWCFFFFLVLLRHCTELPFVCHVIMSIKKYLHALGQFLSEPDYMEAGEDEYQTPR